MMNNKENSLNHLLEALMDNPDDDSIVDLLEAANTGFTQGANHLVEQSANKLQPIDIKNQLRTYSIAQILISIVRYQELNKNTDIVRDVVTALLDSLEQKAHREPEAML